VGRRVALTVRLKNLRQFHSEVRELAARQPLAIVECWGTARAILPEIERQIDQVEKQIKRVEGPGPQT